MTDLLLVLFLVAVIFGIAAFTVIGLFHYWLYIQSQYIGRR